MPPTSAGRRAERPAVRSRRGAAGGREPRPAPAVGETPFEPVRRREFGHDGKAEALAGRMALETGAEAALARTGSGDDLVIPRAPITVGATATADAGNLDAQGLGPLLDNRRVGASERAVATGMAGGSGADQVRQSSLLDVGATAIGDAVNLAVTGAGAAIRGGAR